MSRGNGRIAVVGGGVFGVTSAVELADRGYAVDLYECHRDLLHSTSGGNSQRLHHGYHYPRSPETVQEIQASLVQFTRRYQAAVLYDFRHYVAIAAKGSRVSPDEYLAFCDTYGLDYKEEWPPFLREENVALSLRIREALIDVACLRELCRRDLARAGVRVFLGQRVGRPELDGYDRIVLATYWSLNMLGTELGGVSQRFQFDVYELPVVELPAQYTGCSVLVMDGPFMCLDPHGRSGSFHLGNVRHGIHATTEGMAPLLPDPLWSVIDQGVVAPPCSQ